jgi:hypothetical protein
MSATRKYPWWVGPTGVIKCATCDLIRKLERQSNPAEQTTPPGRPWKYPEGWLIGADGWFCCRDHVLLGAPGKTVVAGGMLGDVDKAGFVMDRILKGRPK